jgi:hypothetical protein
MAAIERYMRGSLVGATVAALAVLGCSRSHDDGVVSRQGALTLTSNAEILGFENPAQWTVSSGSKSASPVHTEGTVSLAIASPVNYTTIVSAALTSAGTELSGIAPGAAFRVDLQLPTTQPNPYWFGAMQMFVTSVSRGVYNQYLGQVELTGVPLGVFKTHEFLFPAFVIQLLQGSSYADLQVTIVLNVPSAGTGTYLLDNLRLRAAEGSPLNVHAVLSCVIENGPNDFEALFGYFNDSNRQVTLPVGPQNRFTPGAEGRGQVQRFFGARVEAAFAVKFNGTEIVWNLPGGAAAASSLSPRCPAPSCPACFRGERCVGTACVTECGDGQCAGDEGCTSCPVDCACAAGLACARNSCGHPAQCGVDWQCGSGTSFGVAVNCPSCPGAQTCVNHVCQ